jgi:ABC-type lipoprotein release transport system permease subunit
MLTSLAINVNDQDILSETKKEISGMLDKNEYEIMDWEELNPELVQQIHSDQYGGFIMLGVLYLIVGFGVLGTLIMMTTERKREFAVMVSIGMQKTKLGLILVLEMILMGLVGIISGIAGSLPVIAFLVEHPIRFTGEYAEIFEQFGFDPIMPAVFQRSYFTGQSLIVLLIFAVAIIYPALTVMRINETKALRA